MTKFRPHDPAAIHERFERIKARTLRRLDEEDRELWRRLRAVEAMEERAAAAARSSSRAA